VIHEFRLFCVALQFLTRIPIPRWVGFEPDWLHQSARHFSAVGLLVGLVAAATLMFAQLVFPWPVAVGLSMAATLLLTGAFHEDGFADTCDALGGGAVITRERALTIMKDSRLGTYATVGLMMMLGLKAACLSGMPLALAVPAMLFAHTISRAASVVLIRALPYAGDLDHAKAKPLAQRISRGGLVVNAGCVFLLGAVLAVVSSPRGVMMSLLVSVLAVAAATAVCARWFDQRLGGYTGDTLGATQQITESVTLLTWLALARL
jgi:adenosylcobinamide-GDP ribazoletransferase